MFIVPLLQDARLHTKKLSSLEYFWHTDSLSDKLMEVKTGRKLWSQANSRVDSDVKEGLLKLLKIGSE